jgi:hypothetical protein
MPTQQQDQKNRVSRENRDFKSTTMVSKADRQEKLAKTYQQLLE